MLFDEPGSGDSYQKLLSSAEAGDPDASCTLYFRLKACLQVPDAVEAFEMRLNEVRKMEAAPTINGARVARAGTPEDAAKATQASIDFLTRARNFRLSVPAENLATPEVEKWLHRAADGGSLHAIASLLTQHGSFGDSRLTPETADSRTIGFVESLNAAARDGNPIALTVMSDLYFTGHLIERSAAFSYGYYAAESQIRNGVKVGAEHWSLRHSLHPYSKLAVITPEDIEKGEEIKGSVLSRLRI